jgi:hypothetical protein
LPGVARYRREVGEEGLALRRQRCPEDGADDDLAREPQHLSHDVDRNACGRQGLPAFEHGVRGAGDRLRQRRKARALKGGLHQAPLRPPQGPLTRRQALAEQGPNTVCERALPVIAMVLLQDIGDMVRVAEEIDAQRSEG